jgi:DNA polymerase III delta prime subunit
VSEQIVLLLPQKIAEALKKRAEREKVSMEELILRAVIKIIEEEMKK